nr:MAG TPA: hypothetical protein [Caudoviricetes sp.]
MLLKTLPKTENPPEKNQVDFFTSSAAVAELPRYPSTPAMLARVRFFMQSMIKLQPLYLQSFC